MADDPLPFLDELAPLPGQVCPFIPAQEYLVESILCTMHVDPEKDFLVDLGCGDGGILLCAAKKFKLCGVGIDINRDLLSKGEASAKADGLDSLVAFHFLSFTSPEFSLLRLPGARKPTIVAIYLIPEATAFFRQQLTDYMIDQAKNHNTRIRVLSIAFKLFDWTPIDVGPSHN